MEEDGHEDIWRQEEVTECRGGVRGTSEIRGWIRLSVWHVFDDEDRDEQRVAVYPTDTWFFRFSA